MAGAEIDKILQLVSENSNKLSAESLQKLYAVLKTKNKGFEKKAMEIPVFHAVLQSSSEKKNGKETAKAELKMAVENGTVIAVKGKGESVMLPEAGMLAPGALEEASYKTIVIPDNSAMIGMEWLTGAKLSGKTKTISVPWPVLKAAYKPGNKEPLSEDLLLKLKPVSVPEDPDRDDICLMVRGLKKDIYDIWKKLPKGLSKTEQMEKFRFLLTPIPEDMPETEEALLAFECDGDMARVLWDATICGSLMIGRVHFTGSENAIPHGTLLTLLLNLIDAPLDSKAAKLLSLLDRNELSQSLRGFYHVDVHSTGTPDISLVIHMICRVGNVELISKMISDYNEIYRRTKGGRSSTTSRYRLFMTMQQNLGYATARDVLLMMDKRGYLSFAADVRGMSKDDLRDELVNSVDELLDENASHTFDCGGRSFTVKLTQEAKLIITDEQTGKKIAKLPKAKEGESAKLFAETEKKIKELQKSITNIGASFKKEATGMLYRGSMMKKAVWHKVFIKGKVARALSCGILWGAYRDIDTDLFMTFCVDMSGNTRNVSGEEIDVPDSAYIGVVDASQLTEDDLLAWKGVFWKAGSKAVLRQFEAPARYIPVDYVAARYSGLSVSVGYAKSAMGYDPYEDGFTGTAQFDGNLLDFTFMYERHQDWGELPVESVCLPQDMPSFEEMDDHTKRLWNRDLIRADAVLHPETKTKETVASGNAEQIAMLIETRMITPDNVQDMLGIAVNGKNTEARALLMEKKHEWLGEISDPFAEFVL